jgi:hypothetical protein
MKCTQDQNSATGIRRTEAALLQCQDIESERMAIHIQLGKGLQGS